MGPMLAPSILSADFARLGEEVREVEDAGVEVIHVDVMDGHFVPNITIGPLVVKALRPITKLPLDTHLMITDPDRYVDDFARAGADWLTVHVEACVHLHRTIQHIKAAGCKAGVALNPATPPVLIEPILEDLDLVLVMTVNPGFGGQRYIASVEDKLRTIRAWLDTRNPRCLLEVDGGVTTENAGRLAAAGCDVLVAGSAIFGEKNRGSAILGLRSAATAPIVRDA